MQYEFEVLTKFTVEPSTDGSRSRPVGTDVLLIVDDRLDESKYIKGGIPTSDGFKVITNTLVHGLINNITVGEAAGEISKLDHIEKIIKLLRTGIEKVVDMEPREYRSIEPKS